MRTATWLQKDGTGSVARERGAQSTSARGSKHVRRAPAFVASVVLLGSAPALAKPSISIIPFGRFPVERQLTHALCAEVKCLASGQLTHHGRVDWERVAAAQLTGVLTGRILRDATTHKRWVDIQVVAPGHVILVRKKAPLQNMALSSASLHALSVELVGVLNRAHGPERATAPVAPVAPVAEPAAVSLLHAPPKPTVPATALAVTPAPAPPAVSPQPVATTAVASSSGEEEATEEREVPIFEVQATFAFLHRQYSYSGGSVPNTVLRDSTVPLMLEPGLEVSVFPVRASTGAFESFGLQAGAAASVGASLQRGNDTSALLFPATSLAANVSFVTRFRLGPAVRLSPLLGWQMMNFDVHKASDGTVLTGQPAVHWRALSAGLKLDVELARWCTFFVAASYLYVYTAGPLTSAPYFASSSSAPSVDAQLGFAFRLAPRFEVRLGFIFTLYAVSFEGAGPAPVQGASDQLLGGTLGFRYTY